MADVPGGASDVRRRVGGGAGDGLGGGGSDRGQAQAELRGDGIDLRGVGIGDGPRAACQAVRCSAGVGQVDVEADRPAVAQTRLPLAVRDDHETGDPLDQPADAPARAADRRPGSASSHSTRSTVPPRAASRSQRRARSVELGGGDGDQVGRDRGHAAGRRPPRRPRPRARRSAGSGPHNWITGGRPRLAERTRRRPRARPESHATGPANRVGRLDRLDHRGQPLVQVGHARPGDGARARRSATGKPSGPGPNRLRSAASAAAAAPARAALQWALGQARPGPG